MSFAAERVSADVGPGWHTPMYTPAVLRNLVVLMWQS